MILMIRPAAAISQHVSTIRHAHTPEPLWRLFTVFKESKVHNVKTAVHETITYTHTAYVCIRKCNIYTHISINKQMKN